MTEEFLGFKLEAVSGQADMFGSISDAELNYQGEKPPRRKRKVSYATFIGVG